MKFFKGVMNALPLSAILWGLILWPCFAQEQPPANVRALSNRVLSEVQSNLSCTTSLFELQDRVKQLEAELAAAKKEPTK